MFSAEKELYEIVLTQSRYTKNKIYSLHEPQTACIAKDKAHKPYEFGAKMSFAMLARLSNVIMGVSHFLDNPNDTTALLPTSITHAIENRGYIGNKKVNQMK